MVRSATNGLNAIQWQIQDISKVKITSFYFCHIFPKIPDKIEKKGIPLVPPMKSLNTFSPKTFSGLKSLFLTYDMRF